MSDSEQSKLMNSKRCDGDKMRIFPFFLAAAWVLVAVSPSRADTLPQFQYDRTLDACQGKLAEWESLSTSEAGESNNSQALFPSGIFMRGRWKQQVSVPIVRPSFLSSRVRGKFDFFSSQWIGSPDILVQNISASMLFFGENPNRRDSVGSILQATGVYSSRAREACLVGCIQQPATIITADGNGSSTVVEDMGGEDCTIRVSLKVSTTSNLGRISAEGTLESLQNASDADYFTGITLTGNMVNNLDQQVLYHFDVSVTALLFSLEAVIVVWQVVYSTKSPGGYFVSMLMILVQIVVMFFLAARLIYVPLRLLTNHRFRYLVTTWAVLPLLALLVLIVLNALFFCVIDRKRRIAKRMNIEERPQELRLASVCIVIYAVIGVVLWSLKNFETYLQVVWCWFLLPQVIANVFWDLRAAKPLHLVYLVGVSLCRILYIGFNSLRPTIYGYDDLDDFPQSWFWAITFTILFFSVYCLLQQRYGGRSFLPQRWFGYQQLPASNAQAILDDRSHTQAVVEESVFVL